MFVWGRPLYPRRWLLRAFGAGVVARLFRTKAFAVDKLTKTDVEYRDRPRGRERCDNCRVWLPPNGCKSVEGNISPRGWCNIWRNRSLGAEISPDEEEKLTKADVAYQGTPKFGNRCDNCNVFEPPDECNSVQGKISPQGWCNIWRGVKK